MGLLAGKKSLGIVNGGRTGVPKTEESKQAKKPPKPNPGARGGVAVLKSVKEGSSRGKNCTLVTQCVEKTGMRTSIRLTIKWGNKKTYRKTYL